MDIMPTLLDLAGIRHPNAAPNHPREKKLYRGRQVYPMRGKSWVPYLTGAGGPLAKREEAQAIHSQDDAAVGWELHGRASLRKGDWKIVNIPLGQPTGTGGWQLYNLVDDRGETTDLASSMPDKLVEMVELWKIYQDETGTIFGPPVKGGRNPLLPDQVGGDPTDDQTIWMRLGIGKRFTDCKEGRDRLRMI